MAANLALRVEGLPSLTFWEQVLEREVEMTLYEDNKAAIQIFKTGYSPALRHTGRTHRISLAWLKEQFIEPNVHCSYTLSCTQSADIFTKIFSGREQWKHACDLINHVDPEKFFTEIYGRTETENRDPSMSELAQEALLEAAGPDDSSYETLMEEPFALDDPGVE